MERAPERKVGAEETSTPKGDGRLALAEAGQRTLRDLRPRGWVLYDADCPTCLRLVNGARRIWERRGFAFIPLQSAEAAKLLGSPGEVSMTELKLCLPNGQVYGGAAAIGHLLLAVGGLKWLGWCLRLPLVRDVAAWLYRSWARRRRRGATACGWDEERQPLGDRGLTPSR